MNNLIYRELTASEIELPLFEHFERRQEVTDCIRKKDGLWVRVSDPFTDDWTAEEYAFLVSALKNTVETGGCVCGAFACGQLKGFVSVEAALFGGDNGYMDMTSLHVSRDMRGQGIGRELFLRAAAFSRLRGGKKLYISAHSAVETQAFYKKMGCVEAVLYSDRHVAEEPCDCQLEYVL